MCALETLLKAFLKSRERTDAIKFAPIPSLNLCSRDSSPPHLHTPYLHTPYWRSPSAPNPRTLAMATLPAMRINASPTAMGRTPLLPFASGTRIEAVRSSTLLRGREAEKRRLERRRVRASFQSKQYHFNQNNIISIKTISNKTISFQSKHFNQNNIISIKTISFQSKQYHFSQNNIISIKTISFQSKQYHFK